MSLLSLIMAEFVGMFVDDEFLAVGVLAVVGCAAVLALTFHAASSAGMVLLGGCIALLVASAVKGIRRG